MAPKTAKPDGKKVRWTLTGAQRRELRILRDVMNDDVGITRDARKSETKFVYAIFKLGLEQVLETK